MALGTCRIANCAIIMKNMMSIAYSMSAVIDPICMAPAPTRLAPSHSTRDSTPLARKKVIESAVANIAFTRMAFSAYSSKVASSRSCAWSSRPKARMTLMPVTVSRRRVVMRSTKPWSRVNMGAERLTATAETASIARATPASTQPIHGSMEKARPTAMMHITGTGKIMTMPMSSACCTTLASERVRATIEPVPKRSKSEPEKASEAS